MALIRPIPIIENNVAVDYAVSISNKWYPVRVDSDGTVYDPISVTSMPTSGEFWNTVGSNIVATKACHITGYKIYSGDANWTAVDVTCNVGDTIMSASYNGGYFMRAEFL